MSTLPTLYQNFIHKSRYARWDHVEKRRETWVETVDRYITYMCDTQCEGKIDTKIRKELRHAILSLEVMPSMRALMTSGAALKRDNVAGFNCAYCAIDNPRAFDEILFILMNGTGVGFSVERQIIDKLPIVSDKFRKSLTVIKVEDSKIGWATAYREMISFLFAGIIPKWDVTLVRPAGAVLKTFGGRASGPKPLEDLFEFTINIFIDAAGRKLTSIECHDICCKIAEIVVVGGVRRSAEISLSNLSDDRMRHAKDGNWSDTEPQRALANNSACYTEKPTMDSFMREWYALYASKSGERGIFNRQAAKKKVASNGRRDPEHEFGTNPCSEIILRSCQFCNLSEVVVRKDDTEETLANKVRLATILGTMQASLTDFRYLRDIWKENTEEECLLGVSMTGILDNEITAGRTQISKVKLPGVLQKLKQVAIDTNKEFAAKIGINQSTSITCVKPSGTVSQLVDCSCGIHPRYSKFYTRNVRADKKDPLAKFMWMQGFPQEDEIGKEDHNWVFQFPSKCNKRATFRHQITALQHLELWKIWENNWCEHKVSITVNIKEHEWMQVGSWIYDHFDMVSGIAFLPYSNHIYRQAPFEECDEKEYTQLLEQMPKKINWEELSNYEQEDYTIGSQELACKGGSCMRTDITTK